MIRDGISLGMLAEHGEKLAEELLRGLNPHESLLALSVCVAHLLAEVRDPGQRAQLAKVLAAGLAESARRVRRSRGLADRRAGNVVELRPRPPA